MGDVRVQVPSGDLEVSADDGSRPRSFSPGLKISKISKSFSPAQMTDNTDATGFIDFSDALPAGALVLGWKVVTDVGFTGDTTAVIQIGVAGALDDLSHVTTRSVLAAGTVTAVAKTIALSIATAARTPRITVTGGTDFTIFVTAGTARARATIYYIDLANLNP